MGSDKNVRWWSQTVGRYSIYNTMRYRKISEPVAYVCEGDKKYRLALQVREEVHDKLGFDRDTERIYWRLPNVDREYYTLTSCEEDGSYMVSSKIVP